MGAFGQFTKKQKGEEQGPCVFRLINCPLMMDEDEQVVEVVKPFPGYKLFKLICEPWATDPLLAKPLDQI